MRIRLMKAERIQLLRRLDLDDACEGSATLPQTYSRHQRSDSRSISLRSLSSLNSSGLQHGLHSSFVTKGPKALSSSCRRRAVFFFFLPNQHHGRCLVVLKCLDPETLNLTKGTFSRRNYQQWRKSFNFDCVENNERQRVFLSYTQ